jgi:REP element-mobilizing transposase RayT
MTCTVVGWLPVFTRHETVKMVLESWKFLQDQDRMSIMGYVILENHLHLIAVGNDLSKEMGDFKSYTARRIIDLFLASKAGTILRQLHREKAPHKTDRDYQLWQEGSKPKEIHDGDMMGQKLEYMHCNPVKRGYVDMTEHWRYSSARNYMGLPGLVDVVTDWA